jgi:hypothetical protein
MTRLPTGAHKNYFREGGGLVHTSSTGGVTGKMIDAQSIVVASTATTPARL